MAVVWSRGGVVTVRSNFVTACTAWWPTDRRPDWSSAPARSADCRTSISWPPPLSSYRFSADSPSKSRSRLRRSAAAGESGRWPCWTANCSASSSKASESYLDRLLTMSYLMTGWCCRSGYIGTSCSIWTLDVRSDSESVRWSSPRCRSMISDRLSCSFWRLTAFGGRVTSGRIGVCVCSLVGRHRRKRQNKQLANRILRYIYQILFRVDFEKAKTSTRSQPKRASPTAEWQQTTWVNKRREQKLGQATFRTVKFDFLICKCERIVANDLLSVEKNLNNRSANGELVSNLQLRLNSNTHSLSLEPLRTPTNQAGKQQLPTRSVVRMRRERRQTDYHTVFLLFGSGKFKKISGFQNPANRSASGWFDCFQFQSEHLDETTFYFRLKWKVKISE